jgi:hypothetical protein
MRPCFFICGNSRCNGLHPSLKKENTGQDRCPLLTMRCFCPKIKYRRVFKSWKPEPALVLKNNKGIPGLCTLLEPIRFYQMNHLKTNSKVRFIKHIHNPLFTWGTIVGV